MVFRAFTELDFADLEAFELLHAPTSLRATALHFFSRSEHSFLAEEAGIHGLVLAQAFWQGDRATVFITRILANSQDVYEGLLRVVVKSAYDSGIYEIAMAVNTENHLLVDSLKATDFNLGPQIMAFRLLGSRGVRNERRGVLE